MRQEIEAVECLPSTLITDVCLIPFLECLSRRELAPPVAVRKPQRHAFTHTAMM